MPRGTTITDEAELQRRLWSPLTLRPDAWFDASDLSTITVATGVSNWRDKSGNGKDFVQATTTKQPTFSGSSLVFSGTQYFSNITLPTFNSLNVFLVAIANTSGSYRCIFDSTSATTTPNWWLTPQANPFLNTAQLGATVIPSQQQSVFSYETDNANGQTYKQGFFINGVLNSSSNTFPTGYPTSTAISPFNRSGTFGFLGTVYELLFIAKALSPSDRQRIEGCLAWKWNLQTKLSASHPYVNRPPLLGV